MNRTDQLFPLLENGGLHFDMSIGGLVMYNIWIGTVQLQASSALSSTLGSQL